MHSVTKQIFFCYGHRLIHYQGKCQHLHGHDARADIVLASASLDHRGMVVDFSDIKKDLTEWINTHIDHKMLLHQDDPMAKTLKEQGEPLYLMDCNPTAENIAMKLFYQAEAMQFPVIEVRLWESPTSCASYSRSE